ncbi:MAG: hypothetical protein HDT44_07400 [Ruminococcaceae bacterium]|nr:hypothetical protein [Oscillospiraceae bacterium]
MCKLIADLIKEEREEGRIEIMIEIAQRMLSKPQYTLEDISEITELSIEEIRELSIKRPA